LPTVNRDLTVSGNHALKITHGEENIPPLESLNLIDPKSDDPISIIRNTSEMWDIYNVFKNKQLKGDPLLKYSRSDVMHINTTASSILIEKYFDNFGETILVAASEILLKKNNCFLIIHIPNKYSSSITVFFYANTLKNLDTTISMFKDYIKDIILKEEPSCYFEWYTRIDGRTQAYESMEKLNDVFYPESYPYLDCNKLIDDYLKCDVPILIMVGPPGTGKTKLIRQILNKAYKKDNDIISCMFTSSKDIIEEGHIYITFLFGEIKYLVLEDIDFHMKSRTSGNYSLYSLLSTSNGLLSNKMKQKKIILTSNLPNVRDIDEALKRPGRCFNFIKTRRLTIDEAKIIASKINKPLPPQNPEYKGFSLGEIYNQNGCVT